jgi:SAM-dependent methyltransferase
MDKADEPVALTMFEACCICGSDESVPGLPAYRRCKRCGHEQLRETNAQTYIVNDPLQADAVHRRTALDRFQDAAFDAIIATGVGRNVLVDIGSGSGRFLVRQRNKFTRAVGIEVTPVAVNFSQNVLRLHIEHDIAAVRGDIDAATAWHSLEHFPLTALNSLLDQLAAKLAPNGRILVSVPNAASFQARFFGRRFAFYDVPNHLHQFTPQSLRQLFKSRGFVCTASVTSWPYNAFGYVQGLLNLVMKQHNYFYYRMKRGRPRTAIASDLLTLALLPFAFAIGTPFALLDALFPERQGVLTFCFAREA